MNISRSRFLELVSVTCLLAGSLFATSAFAATLNVVDKDGVAVSGFRWLVQEDTTFAVDPKNPSTDPDELLSLGFHASYQPISETGNSDTGSATITAPAGRYYVSVLPYSGYSISGQSLEIVDGTETVTVTVQEHPIPTAQIAVYLFHDNFPINGAPDLPEETNPEPGEPGHVDWTQFSIILEEPAGRYGVAGGQVIQDAFGNPLGTEYEPAGCDYNAGSCTTVTLGDGTLATGADGTLTSMTRRPSQESATYA